MIRDLDIKAHSDSHVTVSYVSPAVLPEETDLRVERELWAPSGGGYVYEITPERPGTSGDQVCGGLRHTGAPLEWHPGGPALSKVVARTLRHG